VNVLIVEDDPDARDIASRTISAAGGGSMAVGNADDAIAALATSSIRVDALVSDIGLPGTDGYALLQAVRGLPNDKARIPAIAVTAYASPADAQRALRHGFVAHLSKPYVPAALVAAVRDAVER
jgi:CheY-like chemotaxis protein